MKPIKRAEDEFAMSRKAPTKNSVSNTLGAAQELWDAIVAALRTEYGVLTAEWKASKSDFGWMCILKRGTRTLVYLTPEKDGVRVGIVLGERAAQEATASSLPDGIKALIAEARPYAEGRGFRFVICSPAEVSIVTKLVALKMGPQAKGGCSPKRRKK